jgi:MFS family permease
MEKHKQNGYANGLIAGLIGTIIEWYDFGLFGILAPVIAELFFPFNNKWISLLQAFAIFTIGYLLRPIGGALFGSLADRFGRAIIMRSTILLSAFPSLLIACLPTYQTLGYLSPFLLILLRLLQGLSVGGEFAGAMVYLNEITTPRYRAFMSGLVNNASNIGVLIGVGLCSLLSSIMPHHLFLTIGWRIPFLIGGLLGILGFCLRRAFSESQVFIASKERRELYKQPLKVLFKNHISTLIQGTLLCWMGACGIYTLTVFLSTYLNIVKSYPLPIALSLQSLFLLLTLILVPLASILSNYFGKVFLLKLAAIGNITYAFFAFHYLPTNHIIYVGLLFLPLIFFISIEQGIMPAILSELFPTPIRYSGVAISYNLSYAYIGGAAPVYITWLIHRFNNPNIPAYCIIFTSVITGLTALKLGGLKKLK